MEKKNFVLVASLNNTTVATIGEHKYLFQIVLKYYGV